MSEPSRSRTGKTRPGCSIETAQQLKASRRELEGQAALQPMAAGARRWVQKLSVAVGAWTHGHTMQTLNAVPLADGITTASIDGKLSHPLLALGVTSPLLSHNPHR